MKNIKFIIVLFFLMAGTIVESHAQDNLSALIDKYETSELVEASIIYKRDNKTGRYEYSQKTITIRDNKELIQEFTDAIFKDKASATDIREKIDKGVLVSAVYHFDNEEAFSICTFSREYNNVVKISLRMQTNNPKKK